MTEAGSEGAEAAASGEREAVTLEEKIAEVEAAVATQEDQWEADEPSDADDFYGSDAAPMAWDETQDDEAGEAAKPEHPDAPEPQTAAATEPVRFEPGWLNESADFDEEVLRDLISDIVRQELQGALGERITRNVRKLVRREIQRALMAQKFD